MRHQPMVLPHHAMVCMGRAVCLLGLKWSPLPAPLSPGAYAASFLPESIWKIVSRREMFPALVLTYRFFTCDAWGNGKPMVKNPERRPR